ncbi:MAG: FecR domain-containing protein, partial [Bacteroidota bacterium]
MIDRKLLDKFYKGQCTPNEAKQVLSWFEDQDQGKQNIEEYWHIFEQQYDTKPSICQSIPSASNSQKLTLTFWQNQWLRVAAILLLVFSLSLLWPTFDQQPDATAPVVVRMIEKVTPAGQKTTFQLPDGSLVTLNAESQLSYPERFDGTTRKVALTGEAFFEVA